MKINDSDLIAFMRTFFGYGNLSSDIWMIGMEEGGGNSFDEIAARVQHWLEGGKQVTEDVVEYHEKFGMGHFFTTPPKNQSTWNKLIRLMLSYHGEDTSLENVKLFQKARLARRDSGNCLLELFPLPSPSTNKWIYNAISDIEFLRTRREYKIHLAEARSSELYKMISNHRPKLVVFYGNNPEYRKYWSEVAKAEFKEIEVEGKKAFLAKRESTVYLIVNHPVSTGITNDYFHKLGHLGRAETSAE